MSIQLRPTPEARDLAVAFRKMMGNPNLTIAECAQAFMIAFCAKLNIDLRLVDPECQRKVIDGIISQLKVEGLTIDSEIPVPVNAGGANG